MKTGLSVLVGGYFFFFLCLTAIHCFYWSPKRNVRHFFFCRSPKKSTLFLSFIFWFMSCTCSPLLSSPWVYNIHFALIFQEDNNQERECHRKWPRRRRRHHRRRLAARRRTCASAGTITSPIWPASLINCCRMRRSSTSLWRPMDTPSRPIAWSCQPVRPISSISSLTIPASIPLSFWRTPAGQNSRLSSSTCTAARSPSPRRNWRPFYASLRRSKSEDSRSSTATDTPLLLPPLRPMIAANPVRWFPIRRPAHRRRHRLHRLRPSGGRRTVRHGRHCLIIIIIIKFIISSSNNNRRGLDTSWMKKWLRRLPLRPLLLRRLDRLASNDVAFRGLKVQSVAPRVRQPHRLRECIISITKRLVWTITTAHSRWLVINNKRRRRRHHRRTVRSPPPPRWRRRLWPRHRLLHLLSINIHWPTRTTLILSPASQNSSAKRRG